MVVTIVAEWDWGVEEEAFGCPIGVGDVGVALPSEPTVPLSSFTRAA